MAVVVEHRAAAGIAADIGQQRIEQKERPLSHVVEIFAGGAFALDLCGGGILRELKVGEPGNLRRRRA